MKRILILTLVIAPFASAEEPPKEIDKALRQELLDRVKKDQDARKAMIEAMQKQKAEADKVVPASLAKVTEIDQANTQWLKQVIEQRGWPGKSLVGKDGAQAAWLLVQHADRDHEFQKKCLTLLKAALPRGEVEKANVAYLTDRVLVAEGKKQLYGTQFKTINGKLEAQPIEDEARVDVRRKEMGLGTMAEYRKQIEKTYGK